MQLKKIIAFICLMALCIQLLPVKQIGAMLFNNQITEEISHADHPKKPAAKNSTDYLIPGLQIAAQNKVDCFTGGIYIKYALVKLHFAEVPTPPPNLV